MPVYRRAGSPFFWYSFSFGGCRFRGSTGKSGKREAEAVERDRRTEIERGSAAKAEWTLQAMLSAYWTEHAKDKASSADIWTACRNLQRLLGKTKLASRVTMADLRDYRAARRSERRLGKRGQPIRNAPAAHSINREFAYLHAAYRHGERYHGRPVPRIDWKELRVPEPTWRKRFLAREDEAPAFLAALPTHIREIVICAIVTGLRRGNILSLDWSQVSLAERFIAVTVKGGKAHVVKIPAALMAILSTKAKRTGKVFDATNFRRHWYEAVEAVGLVNFRFHDLRHTFASWARKAGADLPTLREALNHSDISMTMRYANVTPDEVETTFDNVSATLMGTIGGTVDQKTADNGGNRND